MNAEVIGCGPIGCHPAVGCNIGCVVGAEELSQNAGVWVKTRFWREGPYLKATVYSVANGEPKVVELSVDVRPIARAVMRWHQKLHSEQALQASVRGVPIVGWSLKKMWKGVKQTAQKIGRTKLVKGVVNVTKTVAKAAKTVAKSKVLGGVLAVASAFPLTAPFAAPALGAYAAANAAVKGVETGAKVVKTAGSLASTITRGKKLASQASAASAKAKTAVAAASQTMSAAQRAAIAAKAKAAGKIQLTAQGKAAVAATIARAPAGAARSAAANALAARLKTVANLRQQAALAKNLPPAAGKAVVASAQAGVAAAAAIAAGKAAEAKLADPKVRAQLTAAQSEAAKATAALESVKKAAQTGNLDATKSAVIVDLVARNRARIQAMSQANAGGLPGLLITPQGKLVRGRWRVQAKAGSNGTLYTGPGKPTEKGSYTTVSGAPRRSRARVGHFAAAVGAFSPVTGAFAPLTGSMPELVGRGRASGCYDIAGDLPLDGVRLVDREANASSIGPYEEVGCGTAPCAPCSARA
jgi:uncharacterized membrane protein